MKKVNKRRRLRRINKGGSIFAAGIEKNDINLSINSLALLEKIIEDRPTFLLVCAVVMVIIIICFVCKHIWRK